LDELSQMKQNKTKLIETNKMLSLLALCENWVVLFFGARFRPPKKKHFKQYWGTCNISKHFGCFNRLDDLAIQHW
jgi:hypothetical protein